MDEQMKQEMTVQWIVNRKDKKLIKFVEGEDRTYKLADNVLEHLNTIKSNMPVNVTIDGETIVYIAVKGEITKNTEVKKENVPETPKQEVVEKKEEQTKAVVEINQNSTKSTVDFNQNSTKFTVDFNQKAGVDNKVQAIYTYKVKGYSKDLLWWLFEETGEKVWFGVDDKMIPFMRNIKKGDILKISGESRDSRGKDVDFITSAELVTKSTENAIPTNEQPKKGSYSNDADARAKNTAIMVAKDVVVAYINSKAGIVDTEVKTTEMLKRLTKNCYESINQL